MQLNTYRYQLRILGRTRELAAAFVLTDGSTARLLRVCRSLQAL